MNDIFPCFEPDPNRTITVENCDFCATSVPENDPEEYVNRSCGKGVVPAEECRFEQGLVWMESKCYCNTGDLCVGGSLISNKTKFDVIVEEAIESLKSKTQFEYSLTTLTFFTLVLQFYVLYLIYAKTTASMRDYRYFLAIFTSWDMLFNLVFGLFLQPYPIIPNIAAHCRGVSKLFGCKACTFSYSLVFYCGTNLMLSQYYCLTYRFTVTQQNAHVHRLFMSNKVKIASAVGSQVFAIFVGIFAYKTLIQPEDVLWISSRFDSVFSSNECTVFVDNIEKRQAVYFLVLLFAFVLVGEFVSILLVHVTLYRLRKNAHAYSANTHRLHVQFTILLGVQLLTPAIFIVGPVLAAIVCVFLQKQATTEAAKAGLLCLTLYGATNSFVTILFVGPYRQFTKEKLITPFVFGTRRLLGKLNLAETSAVSSLPTEASERTESKDSKKMSNESKKRVKEIVRVALRRSNE